MNDVSQNDLLIFKNAEKNKYVKNLRKMQKFFCHILSLLSMKKSYCCVCLSACIISTQEDIWSRGFRQTVVQKLVFSDENTLRKIFFYN